MQYGYRTTPEIMEMLKANEELKESLSAVAHLIHGSSEGRFKVRVGDRFGGGVVVRVGVRVRVRVRLEPLGGGPPDLRVFGGKVQGEGWELDRG